MSTAKNPEPKKVRVEAMIRRAMRQAREIDRLVDALAYKLRGGDTEDMTLDWVLDDVDTAIGKLRHNLNDVREAYRGQEA